MQINNNVITLKTTNQSYKNNLKLNKIVNNPQKNDIQKLKLRQIEQEMITENSNSIFKEVKGVLEDVKNKVQKITDLIIQVTDEKLTLDDKIAIKHEVDTLKNDIDKISNSEEIDKFSSIIEKNIEIDYKNSDILESISNMSSKELGLQNINIDSQENIKKSLNACNKAINRLSQMNSEIDKYEYFLENIKKNKQSNQISKRI